MRTVLLRSWSTAVRHAPPGPRPLLLIAVLVSALGAQAAGQAGPASDAARLESISARLDRQSVAVLIQATDPVAYVTSQPDPTTVLVDLRNVNAAGAANRFVAAGQDVVSAVTIEETRGFDGGPITRVRVVLAHPAPSRVRSARNVIRVEVDRQPAVGATSAAPVREKAAPAPVPVRQKPAATVTSAAREKAATQLQAVEAVRGNGAPAILLRGNGALVPAHVELTREPPVRLVLDFPGVSPAVAPITPVGDDGVNRVRVALNSSQPLVTRVVVDLARSVTYRLEPSGNDLKILFETPPAAAPAPREVTPDRPAELKLPIREDATAPGSESGKPKEVVPEKKETAPPESPKAAPAPVPAPVPEQKAPVAAEKPKDVPQPVPAAPPVVAPVEPQQPPAVQAQAPPPLSSGRPVLQRRIGEQYTGTPISLDFAGVDIRTVLRAFVDFSGLNIVLDPKVTGMVDISLRDVPWDQALDIVLKRAGLGYSVDGNIVSIAPLDVLANEEKQRRTLAEEQALGGTLETLTRALSYATADDMRTLIEKSLLTKRGQIQTDKRTNTLVVRDLPAALQAIGELIDTLDKPQPQVEIEARIVQTTRNFARQLGVQWGFAGRADPVIGNTTGLAFPNQGSLSGRTGQTQGIDTPYFKQSVPSAVNLGVQAPNSAVGIQLGAINGALTLDAQLSALEKTGQGRILSTPRVVAQNNFPAEMKQGVQIPIQTVSNNTVTVTFKDAALRLVVTPQITANRTVIMNIELENATPDWTRAVNSIPPIDTQFAKTQVLVKDTETLVIGGIYVSREQTQNDRTPGLHRIPLLGWLFRRDIVDESANELLIFITPKIIKE